MHWGQYYKAFPKPHLKWNSQLMLLATLVIINKLIVYFFVLRKIYKIYSINILIKFLIYKYYPWKAITLYYGHL